MRVTEIPRFTNHMAKHGLTQAWQDLKRRLQTSGPEGSELFEPLGASRLVKRRLGNWRLIGLMLQESGHPVLCMVDMVARDDPRYRQLCSDPEKFEAMYFKEKDVQDFVKDCTRKGVEIAVAVEPKVEDIRRLPPSYEAWFDPPGITLEPCDDDAVYEGAGWVNAFRSREIDDYWQDYHKMVSKIADDRSTGRPVSPKHPWLLVYSEGSRGVLFARVILSDQASRRVLFLLRPIARTGGADTLQDDNLIAQVTDIVDTTALAELAKPTSGDEISLTSDQTAGCAARAYPAYVLADPDVWRAIQRDDPFAGQPGGLANIALSGEEEQILRSVTYNRNGGFPLFINGRAGSGKSTLLLYLFADYCYKKLTHPGIAGTPLFLTYNDRLLNAAADTVARIIKSHHTFAVRSSAGSDHRDEKAIRTEIQSYFRNFRELMLSFLPPEDRNSRFAPGKHMSLRLFKDLYKPSDTLPSRYNRWKMKLPHIDWSPELCWYVIRTFIKGTPAAGYLDPDAYSRIPKRDKVVPEIEYEKIYNTVWERWYKDLTCGEGAPFWDDQDLVRQVISSDGLQSMPEYTAIFCDEAQDFTRQELRVILRLSVLPRFEVHCRDRVGFPFAFAGDPLQTLNPTGFRWESLRAAFFETLIQPLVDKGLKTRDMNCQELHFNYRSAAPIVHLSNLVLLWRSVLFRIPKISPQQAFLMRKQVECVPLKFVIGDNITVDQLARHIQNTVIIVPAEEGEEARFVEMDPELKKALAVERGADSTNKNVFSPMSAKGLEFDRVIVYKFGEYMPPSAFKGSEDEKQAMSSEFFFNRLYVALTRAKKYLFIVDTVEGDRKLWQQCVPEKRMEFLERGKELGWCDGDAALLGEPQKGTQEEILGMQELNPVGVAKVLESEGRETNNPDLLRRAARYYEDAGQEAEASACRALAYELCEQWGKAGDEYLKQRQVRAAVRCYRRGCLFGKLVDTYVTFVPANERDEDYRLARFMTGDSRDSSTSVAFAEVIVDMVEDGRLDGKLGLVWWQKGIERFVATVQSLVSSQRESVLDRKAWDVLAAAIAALRKGGVNAPDGCASLTSLEAGCAYKGERYEKAVRLWEEVGGPRREEYWHAKAMITSMPERVLYLGKAGMDEQLLALWETYPHKAEASREVVREVAGAMHRSGRYRDAFRMYFELGDLASAQACMSDALRKGQRVLTEIAMLAKAGVYQGKWDELPTDGLGDLRADVSLDEDAIMAIARLVASCASPTGLHQASLRTRKAITACCRILLGQPSWQSYIAPQNLGAVLEQAAEYKDTLQFYETFTRSSDEELRQFARLRWLKVKQRQVENSRKQTANSHDFRRRYEDELWRRCEMWGIKREELAKLPEYPECHVVNRAGSQPRIVGLPDGVAPEFSDNGVRFRLGDTVVRVRPAWLFLSNNDTGQAIKVMFDSAQVTGTDEVQITREGENCICVVCQDSSVRCRVTTSAHERYIVLTLAGHTVHIWLPRSLNCGS
ncbi:MAG TPA: ATP-dependent helicase [Firmicutes bacterium]|nr:ATP-dependent helicase [Bacillota bacterium]